MKKRYSIVLVIVLLFVVTLFVVFWPKKVFNACGGLPCEFFYECHGVYKETFDERYADGAVGGICFGTVEKIRNEKYEELLDLAGVER